MTLEMKLFNSLLVCVFSDLFGGWMKSLKDVIFCVMVLVMCLSWREGIIIIKMLGLQQLMDKINKNRLSKMLATNFIMALLCQAIYDGIKLSFNLLKMSE